MVEIELGEIYRDVRRQRGDETYIEHGCRVETAAALGQRAESINAGAIGPLCRKLTAAGVADQPWRAWRDGAVVLYGRSIEKMGRLSCHESAGAPHYAPYRPYPRVAVPDSDRPG